MADKDLSNEPGTEIAPVAQPPTKIEAYITRRLDSQIAWLEAKSADAKRKHFGFSATQITATAMIPVANLMPNGAVASTILAAIVAISTGLAALGAHHSHWLRYRAAAEALRKLRLHHEIRLAPFDQPDADDRLVNEVEALLGGEHESWHKEARSQTVSKSTLPKSGKSSRKRDEA